MAKFTPLRSNEDTWPWAKRLVNDLNKLRRVWDLADMDLTGKAGYTLKVKADESGFELVP